MGPVVFVTVVAESRGPLGTMARVNQLVACGLCGIEFTIDSQTHFSDNVLSICDRLSDSLIIAAGTRKKYPLVSYRRKEGYDIIHNIVLTSISHHPRHVLP